MTRRLLPLFFLVFLILTACTKEIEDLSRIDEVRVDADYAIPLIDSKVRLDDLIGDVTDDVSLAVDPDGLLRFRYSGEVVAVGSDVVFSRLDQIAAGIFLPITRERTAAPFVLPGDVELDVLRVKGGLLSYNLTNAYNRPVTVSLSLPDARLNGAPLVITAELPANDGTGDIPSISNVLTPVDLSMYELNTVQDSIYIVYTITDGNGFQLQPSENTVVVITGLRFDYVEGYLGQNLYPGGRDTISVNFFDNYQEGDIRFADPTISMTLTNSFGVPARALIDVLNVIDNEGNVIPIEGSGVTDGFDFDYPLIPGDFAVTTFVFDTSNSNLADILSARPIALDYEVNAIINPDADTNVRGFLTDTAYYRARVDVDLPLVGSADQFTLRDTIPLNIMEEYENVTAVTFRLTTKNGLPIDLEIEGTFLDANDNVLADLTDGELVILEAGEPDVTGNIYTQRVVTKDILLEDARLDAVRDAAKLVLSLRVTTAGGGTDFVRVTNLQELEVLLGAIISVSSSN
ncbi:MAG: hypothetical protein ACJAZ9_000416 [Neolewinella sp.]|jgi:hypothetical protein